MTFAYAAARLKEQQLSTCPSHARIAIVITGTIDDKETKATFYVTQSTRVDSGGREVVSENRYRFSDLFKFNETLMKDYGEVPFLRKFPPKKLIGNRSGAVVEERVEGIQAWMTSIVEDAVLCNDTKVREFFKLA